MAGVATTGGKRLDHFRGKPRHGQRVAVAVRIEEAGGGLGAAATSYTRNLGTGGAFLVMDEPLARGTKLELTVELPGAQPLVCRGEVRWTHENEDDSLRGMGVRFLGLEVEQIVRLNDFLNGLLGSAT